MYLFTNKPHGRKSQIYIRCLKFFEIWAERQGFLFGSIFGILFLDLSLLAQPGSQQPTRDFPQRSLHQHSSHNSIMPRQVTESANKKGKKERQRVIPE